jgi:hypothetical protein
MVLSDNNALNSSANFSALDQSPLFNPSEICALDFEGEFRRFEICRVSTTIGISRPIIKFSRE